MSFWLKLIRTSLFGTALISSTVWSAERRAAAPTQTPTSGTIERVVAVVNGKAILLSELEEMETKVKSELTQQKKTDSIGQPSDFRKRTLDQMINDQLISAEIESRGLSANDSMLDAAIADNMRLNGIKNMDELKRALQGEGLTLEEYRSSLKKLIENRNLMSFIARNRVQITERDVEAALQRKLSNTNARWQSRVRMIFKKKNPKVNVEHKMEEFRKQIEAGIPFERVANRETEGPGKGEGGDIGLVQPSDLQPELGEVVATLRPNEISRVIPTEQGFYLLQCVTRVQATAAPAERMKDEVRAELTKLETERQFDAFVRSLREKAQVEVLL
ncbi:MAG TPA: SurA N-terminal domain-containing protein [Bdellovibrionota bacterium]|nr:SurA N-terminal domain-containing protein [Bdellovibrionota bacterium]